MSEYTNPLTLLEARALIQRHPEPDAQENNLIEVLSLELLEAHYSLAWKKWFTQSRDAHGNRISPRRFAQKSLQGIHDQVEVVVKSTNSSWSQLLIQVFKQRESTT